MAHPVEAGSRVVSSVRSCSRGDQGIWPCGDATGLFRSRWWTCLLSCSELLLFVCSSSQWNRRVISTVAATGRAVAAAAKKYNIEDVAASNKKWTVYELAVQNFLMDAHRHDCTYVLGLRIVVPTALRRPSGWLLRQRRSNPLQTLRRLLRRLLRQRQSIALRTLRRLLCQLLRQRQSTIYGRPIFSDIYHLYVVISPLRECVRECVR